MRPDISSMITRGKVIAARMAARTLLQITGLDQETFSNVELLLPPGYVANPAAGGDVIILQANGVRDHRLAIAGDYTADAIADLQPGEIGLSRGGRTVILRQNWTEIIDPLEIRLVAPLLHWSPDGKNFYRLATETHVHTDPQGGSTAPPTDSSGAITG
jgi:phage gp45-like